MDNPQHFGERAAQRDGGPLVGRLSRHDLADKEWERLEGLLPVDPPRGGRWVGHRTVINGILCRTRAGCSWRDLPGGEGSGDHGRFWRNCRTSAGLVPGRQHCGGAKLEPI